MPRQLKPRRRKKVAQEPRNSVSSKDILKRFERAGLPVNEMSQRIVLEPERKRVRRTKAEFEAGATPSVAGKSERLHPVHVGVTRPMLEIIQHELERQNVDLADFVRGALRAALRHSIDVKQELATEIEFRTSKSGVPLPNP